MNGFLLDTNVISELIKPKPDTNVLRWVDDIEEELLFLSVLTLGEIRYGIERLSPGKRRGRLETWLTIDVRLRFEGRILAIDEAIAQQWGALAASAARRGRPYPVIDSLLAATALHHDLTLVTRNDTDVRGTGVPAVNPWQ